VVRVQNGVLSVKRVSFPCFFDLKFQYSDSGPVVCPGGNSLSVGIVLSVSDRHFSLPECRSKVGINLFKVKPRNRSCFFVSLLKCADGAVEFGSNYTVLNR
jgi:hypothetical protein